jgi:glycosyltransferase involved in cell wall biosynthesis
MISVVILTKNEEKNIKECIESVLWCDEIIVVDDNSIDKTVEIARQLGSLVYFHDLERNFSGQRNFGLTKARHEWVLFVDADERVSEELRDEIRQTISARRNRYNGYYIKRTDVLWGKKLRHGESADTALVRLARKDSGSWIGKVHEVWKVSGYIGTFQGEMIHYPHQTVREFLAEINLYTDLRAEELYRLKVRSSGLSILFYTKAKFLQNYIVKLGILDGMPGLISAVMMSFHSFLVRAKLWLIWNKK